MTTVRIPDANLVNSFATAMANNQTHSRISACLNVGRQTANELRLAYCAMEARASLEDFTEDALISFISKLTHYNANHREIADAILHDSFLWRYVSGQMNDFTCLADLYFAWKKAQETCKKRRRSSNGFASVKKRRLISTSDDEDVVARLLTTMSEESYTGVVSCNTKAHSVSVIRVVVYNRTTTLGSAVVQVNGSTTVSDVLEQYRQPEVNQITCTYFRSGMEVSPLLDHYIVDILPSVPDWKYSSNLCTSLPVLNIFLS